MTDIGLISEDKEGKANPTEQREETVVSRKEPNRTKEGTHQSKQTHQSNKIITVTGRKQ